MNLRWLVSLLIFLIIFSLGEYYISSTPPQGDELHYLITAESIVKDHDIWLENNYRDPGVDRHTVIGADGHEYLYHGLGAFPLTLSLPYYFLGRVGVTIALSILGVLLFWQIVYFVKEVTNLSKLSFLIVLVLFFSLPMANFSFLVFPEIIGALLVIINLRYFLKGKHSLLLFTSLGLMPWIHLRLLPISLILILLWGLKFYRQNMKIYLYRMLITAFLIAGYFIFLHTIYGSFFPTRPYQLLGIQTDTGNLGVNFVNVLIDRQYGLLTHTPLYLLLFPGFIYWYKKQPKQLLIILGVAAIYLFPSLRYIDWHGGYSPPARYLVIILPILIPAIVFYLIRARSLLLKIITFLLGIWGIAVFIVNLLLPPNFGFIFRDGESSYLRFFSFKLGVNIHDLSPSFYPSQSLGFTHMVWLLAFTFFCIFLFFLSRNEK